MLHFEGERHLAKPMEEAWSRLRDARFLVQCIPNAEIVGQPELEVAHAKLHPQFAFVRGTLDVTLRVVETKEPYLVKVSQYSKALGGSAEVVTVLVLTTAEGGTRVRWAADVTSLGGLLKLVPSGLIRGAAEKVINDVWTQVEARLSQ